MTNNKNVEFALKYNKDIPQLAIGDINYRFAIIDRKSIDEQQLVRITDIF